MMRRTPRRGISSPRHTYPITENMWRMLTGLGLALVVLGGTILGIDSARADTNASGHGPGQLVNWSGYSGFWVGAYQTSNGLAICVTPSGESPVGQGGSDPYTVSPGWVDDQGEAASAQQLAEVAYILWWMGPAPTDYSAGMARLATFTVLGYDSVNVYGSQRRFNFDVFSNGSDGQEIANQLGMLDDVQALVIQARAKANTWDGSAPAIITNIDQISTPGDTITASVTLPGVPSGYEVRFVVTKPDGSQDNVTASTDDHGMARLSYVTSPTVQGAYRVSYDITDVPPSMPMAYSPGGSNPQDMFFAAPPSRNASTSSPEVTLRFPPKVGTQVSHAEVTAGDVLTDQVKSENLDLSLAWSLTGVLYGPIPEADGGCEDAAWWDAPAILQFTADIDPSEIDEAGTLVLSGLGPWQVPLTYDNQCVSYGEHLLGRDSAGTVIREADHPAGSPHQIAVVEKKIPEISSSVSTTASHPGDVVSDTVHVTNVVLDAAGVTYEWTYRGELSGPVPPGSSWDEAEVVQTWTHEITSTDVTDDGTATVAGLGEFTIPVNQPAGCYSYAASVDVAGSDGSTYHVAHPVGDPQQTSCVPESWISIGTQISSQSSNPSETITDHLTASGLMGTASWSVHVTLSSADLDINGQCTQADWTEATVVEELDLAIEPDWVNPDGEVDLAGVGAYQVPADEPAHCLTYGETLTGIWGGGQISVVHPPGQESQTTLVASGVVPVVAVTTGGTAVPPHNSKLPWAGLGVVALVLGAVGRCLMK